MITATAHQSTSHASQAKPRQRGHLVVPDSLHHALTSSARSGVSEARSGTTIDAAVSAFPSPPSGAADRRDLAATARATHERTAQGIDRARQLDAHGNSDLWHALLDQYGNELRDISIDDAHALLSHALRANDAPAGDLKDQFDRSRPYERNSSISAVVPRPEDQSYPSGHATDAYTGATILSGLLPHHSTEFHRDAEEVAYSRVYAGVHHPSDVIRGAQLGSFIGEKALRNELPPEKQSLLDGILNTLGGLLS